MSSSLTILPDPRFDAARKHAETARKGLRLTVSSCVALGLELIKLKEEIGATVGRPSGKCSDNPNIKWPELVARETGFCYDRCQDFIKAARAVRERLSGSRKQGDKEVKMIVKTPPSEWADGDYDAFADHIENAFKADTFKALMLDLGFGPKAEKPVAPGLDDGQGDFYDAMFAAHDCVATPILGLHRTQLNPAEFTRYLYELPLADTDVAHGKSTRHIHGLLTLRHILTRAGDEIEAAIKVKNKDARSPKPISD